MPPHIDDLKGPDGQYDFTGVTPLLKVEYDETCATTKIYQTRKIRRNKTIVCTRAEFLKRPGCLSIEAWLPRRKVVEWMNPDTYARTDRGETWWYMMPVYEIVKASAKRERDWGHLVWTDLHVERCLLVMVLPPPCDEPGFSHEDYATLIRWHAHRFMAMCMCIFHDDTPVKWVRATYVTEDQLARPGFYLHRSFLHSAEQPPPTILEKPPFPPIFTVSPETVEPCLLASDITRIDSIRAQDPECPPVPVPESVRNQVLGSRDTRPEFRDSWWQEKHYRQCSYGPCNVSKDRGLMMCSRCKNQYYCGKECQRLAWPDHKRWCRAAF